ncbi:hypothetical protein L208DRAFT_1525277, partial [Tricholoma matsutake]
EPEDSEIKYQKDVEEGLREWIETSDCQHDTSAIYFNDGTTGICCDHCLRKSDSDHPLLAMSIAAITLKHPISPSSDTEDSPWQEADEDGKWQMAEGARVANHQDSHLKGAQELLEKCA